MDETTDAGASLPPEAQAAEETILAALASLDIAVTLHRHPPLFTVADSVSLRGDLPGAHVKNMFLKDKKGGLWLVTCLEDRRIRISDLQKALGAPKMSFGKEELLWETLGVRPGAVTPLALWTDRAGQAARPDAPMVRAVFDAALSESQLGAGALVNCHPLHNQATVAFAAADLFRFAEACGHTPTLVDFGALEAAAEA